MHENKGENKRKYAGRIAGAVLLLLLILAAAIRLAGSEKNAVSREDRLAYIAALGWEADPATETVTGVQIPDCGDGAMRDYNDLMKKADFDLAPYEGKTVEQYQYELKNYPDVDQTVILTLYVYRGRVIGGDIHTAALDGFMHELKPKE